MENDKIHEYDTVVFTCSAHANPSDVTIRWYRNDEPCDPEDGRKDKLVIKHVTRRMNGETVTCEVRNSVGTTKTTHTLNVYYKPHFKSDQDVVSAALGECEGDH